MLASMKRIVLSAAYVLVLCAACGLVPGFALASAAVPAAPIPVVERTIDIVDPELGPLVFDALAAGDPSAAQQGRLVLLLHGFPESAKEFREILPALAAAGYYAVAPSQRGYSDGARPLSDSQYTIDHMVTDTLSMATALGADRFHLVGHDWGGVVGWNLAAAMPWRLATLTVLSTPHPNAAADSYANPLTLRGHFLYAKLLFEPPGAANIILAGGPRLFALESSVIFGLPYDRALEYANDLDDPVKLNAALAWYRANELRPPQRIGHDTVPTLYVWGNQDFAFSKNSAERTALYADGPYRFVTLSGVNHWVTETDAEAVTQLILSQLQ